jgi:membrane protein
MNRFLAKLRDAVGQSLDHDVINTAKAVAYSGMLMIFPALLVMTTVVAQLPESNTLVGAVRATFEQLLPADTLDLLQSYVLSRHIHSGQVILSATSLSVFAGLGMMLSLMEGFRRAYRLPLHDWGFWSRRLRALLLVPIALVPLSLATLVVVFGHQIEGWMIDNADHELRHAVIFFWRMIRWSIALITSMAVLIVLYVGGAGGRYRHAVVVSGHAGLRLVRDPGSRLFHVLRIVRRRYCHAGLALHHSLQRVDRRGAEWRAFQGPPGKDPGRRAIRFRTTGPVSFFQNGH